MIVHVVDASRYLTDIELDILTFSLIDALSDRRKKRVEQNGTSFAPWLKSLANFCGTLFRRHSVDLGGVLRYIYNQLAVDNPYDLLVLQEMITSMSGIRIAEDVTNEQIEATGAGETLRRESLMFESVCTSTKSTKRLLDALMDSGLIVPIGILMANLKRDVICTADTHELKVIGWLHDHVRSFHIMNSANDHYCSILIIYLAMFLLKSTLKSFLLLPIFLRVLNWTLGQSFIC